VPGTGFEWVVGALGRPADCAGTEHEIPEARGAETGAAVALLADAVHARFGGSGSSGATLYVASGDPGRGPGDTLALTQTLTGVLALAPGGHLVSSAPALTTSFSRSLVALVAALFDEVYVAKPLASLPTNGTVYLVGKGFHGISAPLAESLLARLGALARGPPPAGGWPPLIEPTLCASVDGALLRVARQVYGRQQATFLAEAGSYYAQYQGRRGALSSALAPDARRAEEVWLASNPVRALQEGFWLWP